MIIKNVKVYGEDFQFHPGDVVIENGVFCETASNTGEVIDGEGAYAIPGLIDIHFHGCMGADVCDNDPEAIRTIAEYEASVGVTTIWFEHGRTVHQRLQERRPRRAEYYPM